MKILIDSGFIHYINRNVKLDKKTTGKWLIFDKLENLDYLFHKLNPFIENGKLSHIKFTHRALDDPFKDKTPVMCIYADDNNKEEVWNILSKLGVNKKIWKYDAQTYKDWKNGGRLDKEWNLKK